VAISSITSYMCLRVKDVAAVLEGNETCILIKYSCFLSFTLLKLIKQKE